MTTVIWVDDGGVQSRNVKMAQVKKKRDLNMDMGRKRLLCQPEQDRYKETLPPFKYR
jgi:hypothetical protein